MEIEQIWQYGKERGAEFYSPFICNVDYYKDGHYMVHSGGIGTYRGKHVDTSGVRRLRDLKDHIHITLYSITVEVENYNEVKYELKVYGGNYYRSRRVALYDETTNFALGKGKFLGGLGVTPEFEMKVKYNDTDENLDARYNLSTVLEEDRLAVRGTFVEGSQVILELRGQDGSKFYLIPTEIHDPRAICVEFDEQKATDQQFYVSKEGMFGEYQIYLSIDNLRYDLKELIKI